MEDIQNTKLVWNDTPKTKMMKLLNMYAQSDAIRQKTRRERLMMSSAHTAQVRRGMIRYMELVIDLSKAASIADMRPLRSGAMFGAAKMFIRSFFDENPLSQLGIVVMRDGVAFQLTELSSSPVRESNRDFFVVLSLYDEFILFLNIKMKLSVVHYPIHEYVWRAGNAY
jgi:hypothetical protein